MKPRKRSVVIRGHPTSISIEDHYWDELTRIACSKRISVSTFVGRIEYESPAANLSAAIRAHLLTYSRG